jgi:hypothetical protein
LLARSGQNSASLLRSVSLWEAIVVPEGSFQTVS